MNDGAARRIRAGAVGMALACPLAGHLATALGRGYGPAVALGCAAAQAVASGTVLWLVLGRHRRLGPLASALLLLALALGARHSARDGVLAAAGLGHAMLYGGLLALFAASLRRGHIALVTMVASRLNPRFHAGMVPYTRAVTLAWCLFFAAQLAASATLLALHAPLWPGFVSGLHAPLVLVMAGLEFLVRRWRWRHEHYTSLTETIGGVRRLMAQRANASTTR